jgi:DNA-binding response OmpR family regulator
MLASTRPRARESGDSKFRLLYVGNDLELTAALRKMLPETDFRLVTCADGESAIMFLKSDIPYQLLLIDFEWRGKEGLKLARVARSLRHRKRMPVVLVSVTELSQRLKVLARKANVKECVTKSPDMRSVIEAIRRMIGEK